MAALSGNQIVARSLKQQGVDYMFGVVGFPVYDVASQAQAEGIRYLGFRNEQSASYAAGAIGYLTGRPGACLCVSGPGMVHGLAGLSNAWSNNWPMILLGGANDSYQNGQGAFQEAPQVEAARPFAKYAARPDQTARLPYYVEQAVRTSINGRPGASYLDLSHDTLYGEVDEAKLRFPERCPEPVRPQADPASIDAALAALRSAKRPLVIVGKGAAYSGASDEVREFIEKTQLPFLQTPMGKGVVPDSHSLSVAPARSFVLQNADLILLIGARLNWILHFGLPPRFADDVRGGQSDISADEIGTNRPAEVGLVGDARNIVSQLNQALDAEPWSFAADSEWRSGIVTNLEKNQKQVDAMLADDAVPMGYYRVLREIREQAPPETIYVAEGANTMDISRSVLANEEPKRRLDAGSFGTMGVGAGFAIATAVAKPDNKVVCVQGDSAFGFAGMEVETACRYQLPITFVVINNNGIGIGGSSLPDDRTQSSPGLYTIDARYDKVVEAFGRKGYFARTPDELSTAMKSAMSADGPALVNVAIDPKATGKPQKFGWLTH